MDNTTQDILKRIKENRTARLQEREAKGQCTAVLHHGRGHQSETFCELMGQHDVHRCEYGRYGEIMEWRGMTASTGFFDEPVEMCKRKVSERS